MLSDAVSSATKKRSSSLGTNRLLKKASCLFQNTKTKKCDFYFFLRNQRLTSRRFRQDIHALVAGGRNSVNFNSLLKRLCGSQNVLVRREAARSATAAAVVRKYNAGAERRCTGLIWPRPRAVRHTSTARGNFSTSLDSFERSGHSWASLSGCRTTPGKVFRTSQSSARVIQPPWRGPSISTSGLLRKPAVVPVCLRHLMVEHWYCWRYLVHSLALV